MAETETTKRRRRWDGYEVAKAVVGIAALVFVAWRIYEVGSSGVYGADSWVKFAISGLVIGGVYALIAIGYTLVYGIMFMINFAHGEVMMLGAYAGYFVFEALSVISVGGSSDQTLLHAFPVLSVIAAFAAGMLVSTVSGVMLERIAYRPLRGSPRLVALISAIGASIFLQNAAQLVFGPKKRTYASPDFLTYGKGWIVMVAGNEVKVTYTGVFTFVLSVLLLVALWLLVQRSRLGRAMRAVAEDKQTAALMGIDVDGVISRTFAISGALAGAAGVMWGIHNPFVYHYVGFIPGLKAFTAAVLGGIGNIPGAMLGGLFLGVIESVGPAALGIQFQLKDVIAFSILVLVLIFRPSGILGEVLSEEKI